MNLSKARAWLWARFDALVAWNDAHPVMFTGIALVLLVAVIILVLK